MNAIANMKVGARLGAGFGVLLLLLVGVATLGYLRSLDARYLVEIEQEDVAPQLELSADWETYLAGLSKKDRHELRRKFFLQPQSACDREPLIERKPNSALSETWIVFQFKSSRRIRVSPRAEQATPRLFDAEAGGGEVGVLALHMRRDVRKRQRESGC